MHRSSLTTAAGRACKSVAQQGEPAQAWCSRKSLHKRGAAERACTSVVSKQKTAEHNASAKLEETLGKLQQMLANNAEAEVSRKSAEKERRTVEQTELQTAQEAQEAILHDIQTTLDSISKRVTAIEETQQRDWQTQVQQHDNITKIQTQMLQQQQAMHWYEKDALDM